MNKQGAGAPINIRRNLRAWLLISHMYLRITFDASINSQLEKPAIANYINLVRVTM
jgi:hypothetical protein